MACVNWIGTLNNPTEFVEEYLRLWHTTGGARYVCGQLEKGAEGTPHIQYFLNFEKPGKRLAALKKMCDKSHFEQVKQNNGADMYCMKEDTRLEGPWEFGIKPVRRNLKASVAEQNAKIIELGVRGSVDIGLIRILDADKVLRSINVYNMDKPTITKRAMKAIWICGPPGTGKTHRAVHHSEDSYYMKNQNKWWDGYQGQRTVILDDLDAGGRALGHLLKRWADVWSAAGEVKGGTVPLTYDTFIVTSNYTPGQIWVDLADKPIKDAISDRFEMVYLDGESRRQAGGMGGEAPEGCL